MPSEGGQVIPLPLVALPSTFAQVPLPTIAIHRVSQTREGEVGSGHNPTHLIANNVLFRNMAK
jgi:hypothetical protein